MIYTTYDDMAACLRRNLWKIPSDIDLIVGIPRSGMLAALMLAELMNKRCVDLDAFVEGRTMSCGGRGRLIGSRHEAASREKVLVMDDTVFHGNAMRKARDRVQALTGRYDILFGCVYVEGYASKTYVDIWLEDIYNPLEKWYFYEWNILHHYGKRTIATMWDIDGLICKNPPDDRDTARYESYLPDAVPMVIPTTTIGAFVTYRLERYRTVTEQWLRDHDIEFLRLVMFDAPDRDTRARLMSPAVYKAQAYNAAQWAVLFFESSQRQAEEIFRLTGKPVYCYVNGKMYV